MYSTYHLSPYVPPYLVKVNIVSFNTFIIIQYQWTPLHLAAQDGHYSTVERLIKCGANVNAVQAVSYYMYYCTISHYMYHCPLRNECYAATYIPWHTIVSLQCSNNGLPCI